MLSSVMISHQADLRRRLLKPLTPPPMPSGAVHFLPTKYRYGRTCGIIPTISRASGRGEERVCGRVRTVYLRCGAGAWSPEREEVVTVRHVRLLGLLTALVALGLLVIGCGGPDEFVGGGGEQPQVSATGNDGAGTPADSARKIVVFAPGVPANERAATVRAAGGQVLGDLRLIHGVAAILPEAAARRLAARADVVRIEVDYQRELVAKPDRPPGQDKKPPPEPEPQPDQTLEWNIDRIDAELAWAAGNTGAGVKLAIIDTGVGPHPDLKLAGSFNATFVGRKTDAKDLYGHGTHCAGIAAALDNDFGVVGVAPDADLYAVRVMDKRLLIYDSYIVNALQWCIDHGIQVASMSLGGDEPGVLGEACQAAADAGIVLVAAAGNDYGGSVDYPAAFDTVIAVSATDASDSIADFSNRGPEVELAAPGVDVRSTCTSLLDVDGDGYEVLSGTSMATPHVAGVACLAIRAGTSDVRAVLQQTADDLGTAGRDPLYGFGLVDAEEAAQGGGGGTPPPAQPVI